MAEEITKQEAVRRALKAMGRAATPSQMQPYIKENFGIDMSTDHISTSKGIILHPKKKGGKGAKKPAAQGAEPTEGDGKEAGLPLDDILFIKGLVGRLGPDQLHTLIDAFAR